MPSFDGLQKRKKIERFSVIIQFMKKFFVALAFGFVFPALASSFSYQEKFTTDPVLSPDLYFSVTLNKRGEAEMTWDKWEGDFIWYKISRSEDNPNLMYPEDGFMYYSTDRETVSYIDRDPFQEVTYYRLCVITPASERFCSNSEMVNTNPNTEEDALRMCIQVVTPAKNAETGECKEFPTPCDVPEGWQPVGSCYTVQASEKKEKQEKMSVILKISSEKLANIDQLKSLEEKDAALQKIENDLAEALQYDTENQEIQKLTEKIEEKKKEIRNGEEKMEINVSVQNPFSVTFSDIPGDTEEEFAILFYADKNVVKGFEDGTFQKEKSVTRAEISKIAILAAEKSPSKVSEEIFCDVPKGEWFAPYVHFFAENGYAKGFEKDGIESGDRDFCEGPDFFPHDPVKRSEATKMILEILEIGAADFSEGDTSGFIDVAAGHWFAPYAKNIDRMNIFEEEYFRPNDEATRGEVLYLLKKSEEYLKNKKESAIKGECDPEKSVMCL